MKRNKVKFPFKLISVVIILLFVLYFMIVYLGHVLKNLDCFKIKDIVVKERKEEFDFSHLKGRNIFSIDLIKESKYLSELYPAYKKIRVVRILPNRLFIDFIKRKPIAYIKLYRYFCVDEDSILFDVSEAPAEESDFRVQDRDLPVILGLETKIFGPKPGRKYNVRELALALEIIKEMKRNNALKDYKIKIIDVANIGNTSFFVSNGFNVKVGQDNIKDKINVVSGVLTQSKNDLANIEYIDLRFKEPVIKFRDAK